MPLGGQAQFHSELSLGSFNGGSVAGRNFSIQGGPNPVFLNPVFQGSVCIQRAALHGLTLARKLHDFPEF